MDYNLINRIVKIITRSILTPVIYMNETEKKINFICFCDAHINLSNIYDTENELIKIIKRPVEIIDIRFFKESERMDIINSSELIHFEHPVMKRMFEFSMAMDYQHMIEDRNMIISRIEECGTCYLQ